MKLDKIGGVGFSLAGVLNGFVFGSCVLLNSEAFAKTARHQENSIEEYRELFLEQQKEFEKQRRIITEQGKEIEMLKARLDSLTNSAAGVKAAPVNQAAKPPIVAAAAKMNTGMKSSNPLPSKPVGEAPPQTQEKARPPELPRLSETVGGVLTRKGNLVFEPSLEYSYIDNNRVFLDAYTIPAITIGLIDIRQIKRHTFIGSLSARYGITDRLELEFKTPYVYREDTQRSRPVDSSASIDETFNATGTDIGDLEFAARYQLSSGSGGWPILVGNLVATVPTGTSPFDVEYATVQGVPGAQFPTELPTGVGYFSFQPSITAMYPTDPAVFFGNISYSYNAETSEAVGDFDPGDAIGLSFGMGFGLNERSSFSLGYSHKHVFKSDLNGAPVDDSELDIGQLLVGYSFKYTPKTTLNLSLGIGTTDDSQDVKLNVRVPMTFDLFPSGS
ncbi:transporter [Methylobacter sp. YRD-M1]|uniref:transporter n=1 Tax=Methylobacter sp. YRD-M1 TaxID=2911520 RepID=UPI00227D4436|nr:transporter [Methylobacter sp. YRD-M1]WAK02674.1 transporter [Methylobacter sp. YRD-M1]